MARAPGSFTSRERDAVRLVGPMAPATKRGRPGSRAIAAKTARRAAKAPATLRS